MVNRERVSLSDSSERLGRWLMSTLFFFRSGHPLYDARLFFLLGCQPRGRHPNKHYFE
jgi:hypothetical protein